MHQRIAFAILSALIVATAAPRAEACDFPIEDLRFFRFEAPVDGTWWVHAPSLDAATVTLADENGAPVEVAVVSAGVQSSRALRVPALPVGTRLALPDTFERPYDGGDWERFLVVSQGTPPPPDETVPAPPEVTIEWREVRVGYVGVLTSPIGGECSHAPGLWSFHYDERPTLLIPDPGEGLLLDVVLQPPDEDPFEDLTSANEILFDGLPAAAIDTVLADPPGAVDTFWVHARVRRIDDAAVSEVVSLEVTLDDAPPEERLEWVGCTCSSGASSPTSLAPALLGLAWLGWRGRRRWHR